MPKNGIEKNINKFVFSLNKKGKYQLKKLGFIVWRKKNIQFGRSCIRIVDKCSKNENNYIRYDDFEFQLILF